MAMGHELREIDSLPRSRHTASSGSSLAQPVVSGVRLHPSASWFCGSKRSYARGLRRGTTVKRGLLLIEQVALVLAERALRWALSTTRR
jgi:hypothetical protein